MRSDFQFNYWAFFEAGQNAAKAGQKEVNCPEAIGSAQRKAWLDGFAKPDYKRGGVSNASEPKAAA